MRNNNCVPGLTDLNQPTHSVGSLGGRKRKDYETEKERENIEKEKKERKKQRICSGYLAW